MKDLLKKIQESNLLLEVVEGNLKVYSENSDIDSHLISEIKEKKEALIQILSDSNGQNSSNAQIPSARVSENYPLSSSQFRLWVLSQFSESNVAYNMPGLYVFEGELDTHILQQSFEMLIARHESLRTSFRLDDEGQVRQYITKTDDVDFVIGYEDMREDTHKDDHLKKSVSNHFEVPFDLSNGPLIRARLYHVDEKKWLFSYVMHHIISDGWSMDILFSELLQLYKANKEGAPSPLIPLRIQYKDYACWQQEHLKNGSLQADKAYWLQQFDGLRPVLELHGDKERPAFKTFNGAIVETSIEPLSAQKLKQLAQQQGSTLFMALVALVKVLLFRYTHQEDIIIGSPIAGRSHADLDGQVGFYVNTLPLRTQFQGSDSFISLLENIKEVTLEAYAHQAYPFDELVEALNLLRDTSRSPLFDVMVVLQNSDPENSSTISLPGPLHIDKYEMQVPASSKFDLLFAFVEAEKEIRISLEYNNDIYQANSANRMISHLKQLLEQIVSQPNRPICDLDYLNEQEKNQILVEFNASAIPFPHDRSVVNLFEEQVLKHPLNVALVHDEQQVTYNELNELSNQWRDFLNSHYQLNQGDLIAVLLPKGIELMAAILGILKSGCAYVPIDSSYPQDRIDHMIKECACKVLIDHNMVSKYRSLQHDLSKENISSTPSPNDLAYVMYTSGSTGIPKGVMIEHRSIVRLVKSSNYIDLNGEEVLLSTGSFSFDATTFEYWAMLLNGGKLILADQEVLLDHRLLASLIKKKNVDTMWFTVGWFNQLVEENIDLFAPLKNIITGGDALSPKHINTLRSKYPNINIINGYGPTENTTFSTTYPITADFEGPVPIGKPISNSTAYILDPNGHLCPVGVPGEIYLAGAGLARGYFKQPDLSIQKFVNNPFINGQRMYKTGDRGKWLNDGNIAFLGRNDHQVKVRGYRIEPGEIESIIARYDHIEAVVVTTADNGDGDKTLIAYLVGDQQIKFTDLRSFVGTKLPDYMVPSHYVQLSALPLTINGKVDRDQLPKHNEVINSDDLYVPPRNEIEEKLVIIWKDILGVDKIGVKDNFFLLGGHSLKATRLLSHICKTFEVNLNLMSLFSNPTIEGVADEIDKIIWADKEIVEADDVERFAI